MDKGRGLWTAGRAGLLASVLGLLSFVHPLAAQADAYSDYRGSVVSGDPQSVMLSYYDGPDTRGFAWQTAPVKSKTTPTVVETGDVWLLRGDFGSDADADFDTNRVVTATSVAQTDCYTHKAHVTGLSAGRYSYRLGAVLGTTKHYAYGKFEVREQEKPVVILNVNDVQTKDVSKIDRWDWTLAAAKSVLSGLAITTIVSGGDFIDNGTSYSNYIEWGVATDKANAVFPDVPWTMTSGNHDPSLYNAVIDEHFQVTSGNWGCHSYDVGGVHVASIPFNSSWNSSVGSWLEKDLDAAQNATWRIVSMHFGPYTTVDNGYNASADYVKAAAGICAKGKVDLVLQAHDHGYSKTLPYLWSGSGYTSSDSDKAKTVSVSPAIETIAGEDYYFNPEGTVYISAGCAGHRVNENGDYATSRYTSRRSGMKIFVDTIKVGAHKGEPATLVPSEQMFGVLTVDSSTLKYDWYLANSSGSATLFDTLRISKAPPEPPHDEDEAITVAFGAAATVTTITNQTTWSYAVTDGEECVAVSCVTNDDNTATFTFTGVEAGTATVVIYQEDGTTPLKTVTVTVLPPDPMTTPIKTTFNGKVVTTIGAVIDATDPSGDLILIYTNTTAPGSLVLQQEESARILVVGGGGAAAAGGSNRYGSSGNGGRGSDISAGMPAGTYSIQVGVGGQSACAEGVASSIGGADGFATIVGPGADAQTDTTSHSSSYKAGADGFKDNGGLSDITGESLQYGAGGAKASSSSGKHGTDGTAGTGNGGVGGYGSSSEFGKGGSGIVVVRLKFSEPPVDKDEAITLSVDEAKTITTIAAQATWSYAVTDGADLVAVSCVTNDDDTATFTFNGVKAGTATVVIYQEDGETPLKTVTVTVLPPDPMTTPIKTKLEGRVFTSLGAIVDSTMAPGELIFVYTNTAAPGSLEVPEDATARILVVGGGGGGASGKKGTNRYYGDGGSGGQGVDTSVTLPVGTYAITVGAGGAGISGGTSDPEIKQGEDGRASKFAAASGASGFEPLDGAGGAKGGNRSHKNANSSSGSAGFGESDITGTTVTYGAAGAGVTYASTDAEGQKPGTDGDAGTGAGGGGAGCNSMSGAGGSGIVIVRITGFVEVTPPVEPLVTNKISYVGLEGAANPNPTEFTTNDLPIMLSAPGGRDGYTFAGWTPNGGVIPVGTTEDVTFTANWTAVGPAEFCVTPYLQRPAPDAMTIVFFTDRACGATVTCGAQTTNTVGVWAEALTNNLVCKESSAWNNSLYKHSVRFTGLEPNGNYEYAVTLDGGANYTNAFHTAPDRNTPIRFVSYADCETEKNPWSNYVNNLKRMKERAPDFIAIPGDFTARGGIQSHWDGFWKANAGSEGDISGSIPLLTVLGNHDLYDNGVKGDSASDYKYDLQGETGTERYLAYFENEPNGVEYTVRDGTNPEIPETRDLSQLFHRVDYGPVTLIFLDTNDGDDNDPNKDTNYETRSGNYCPPGIDRSLGGRHPDFNPGTPQYDWLTNQLADAQQKSRFTFVFNHHCPYSRGAHNNSPTSGLTGGSAQPVRILTETMVRYGVDGWYCAHDELLEHSITNGWEILPDGSRRKHTLSIYDLGCSGDSPRDSDVCKNPLEYWWSSDNYGGSGGYGFLETDVTTNRNGQWTCTITPIQGSTGNPLSAQVVYVENQERDEDANDLVYAEAANASHPIDGASQTKPSDWLPLRPSSDPDEPDDPDDPSGEDDEGTEWQSSYTIQEGETTDVIWCEYVKDGKLQTRWWKFDGGDASIATPAFVDANPNEPKMSGSPTERAKFTIAGVKAGETTWTAYTYTDGGQQADGTYPGYSKPYQAVNGKTYGSNAWSDGSMVSIKITVTAKQQPTPFELLCAAATAGEAYVIEDDMEFPAGGVLTVPAGAEFVLDLKGHAIVTHADGAIVNHGKLTILDSTKASPLAAHLTYSAAEFGKGYALVRSDGELVVDGVFVDAGFVNGADSEFGGGNTAIAATAGKVVVKNGAHVGGRTALAASGEAKVEIFDSHAAGWRWGGAVAEAATVWDNATLLVSNATMEAEGHLVSAAETAPPQGQESSRGGGVSPAQIVTIVDSVLATSRTTAPFDLASGAAVTVEKTIYVDRMAKWFPVTTALANEGADLKVGAGCLLAVANEGVVGFLDEGVTAAEVAPRVWRTKGADDEALPSLTPEEEAKIAEVLSSSPDALLKTKVTTVKAYTDYKAWVDAGVASGAIESEAAAKGAAGSFFSFATAQPGIVDTEAITEEKVEVKKMEVNDGGSVKLTVGIADLPVGEGAKQEYLEQIFGVTGTGSLEKNDFAAENVVYKQDMVRNADGTVSYTVEPKTEDGEAKPAAFFFKASVAK